MEYKISFPDIKIFYNSKKGKYAESDQTAFYKVESERNIRDKISFFSLSSIN